MSIQTSESIQSSVLQVLEDNSLNPSQTTQLTTDNQTVGLFLVFADFVTAKAAFYEIAYAQLKLIKISPVQQLDTSGRSSFVVAFEIG